MVIVLSGLYLSAFCASWHKKINGLVPEDLASRQYLLFCLKGLGLLPGTWGTPDE